MGLDIYAGTLTRYYGYNWKNIVQQFAEENGFEYQMITPEEQKAIPTVDKIIEHMSLWRDGIIKGLLELDPSIKAWEENNTSPYYADRPDLDAFGALLLYTACKILNKPVPETIAKGFPIFEHPLIKTLKSNNNFAWSLFTGVSIWIPVSPTVKFMHIDPFNNKMPISTVGLLSSELESINKRGWNADEETILSWADNEGYPADYNLITGKCGENDIETAFNIESLAKYAYSIFYQAVLFAKENQVPVKMHF